MRSLPAASTDRRIPTSTPVTAEPATRESIAATWLREIAAAVAAALNTTFTDASYLLTLRDHLPAPRRLQARFSVAGHHVDIDARWPGRAQAPLFGLRVDDRDITVDDNPTQRPAVTLAHAAWRAILDRRAPTAVTADTPRHGYGRSSTTCRPTAATLSPLAHRPGSTRPDGR